MSKDLIISFQFNPFTGNKLKQIDEQTLQDEVNGQTIYLNPKPCSVAIIENKDGKILLVKRRLDPFCGSWDLPGGFMNLDETVETSVIRECREELNVDVQITKYLGSIPEIYEFGEVSHKLIIMGFRAQIINRGELVAKDDVADFGYFGRDEIPWEEIKFECIRFFVNKWIAEK